MVTLNEVSSANIQIADFSMFGRHYALYIKKNTVNSQFLVKIEEISKNQGLSVTCSNTHYIII